jgi:hypothetical protein
MLLSKFGVESLPQKKKSNFRIYFFIILLALIAGASYWIFKNYQRIIFHFKKDKYETIIQNLKGLETIKEENTESFKGSEELLTGLIEDNPSDSYLYFLSGKLYYIETGKQILQDGSRLTELLFLDYINRYHFPRYISNIKWEKGIAHLRKAILLQLQDKDNDEAVSALMGMYIAGGSPYWQSAKEYLDPEKQDPLLINLYHLVYAESEPDWALFSKVFGDETTTIWTAMYNMKIRNYPLAFYFFKKLLLSENVNLRNSAYYLMGHLMGQQKNMALKMYYHSMIDYDEFLKKNPWFLEEHNYTLRFMGAEAASRSFLGKYEQMVLEIKEAL